VEERTDNTTETIDTLKKESNESLRKIGNLIKMLDEEQLAISKKANLADLEVLQNQFKTL